MSAFDQLSAKEKLVLAALLKGASHVKAAEAGHVSPKTVQRMLGRELFALALDEQARALYASATRSMKAKLPAVLRRLDRLSRHGVKGDATKVRATIAIMVAALRLGDGDVEERLRALEERLGDRS